MASNVKTRTVVQTRTHAQKYFQKVTKSGGSGYSDDEGGYDGLAPGTSVLSGKRTSGRRTRRSSAGSYRSTQAASDQEDYYDYDEYDDREPAQNVAFTPVAPASKVCMRACACVCVSVGLGTFSFQAVFATTGVLSVTMSHNHGPVYPAYPHYKP